MLHERLHVYKADWLYVLQDLSNYNKNAVIIAKKYFSVPDIDDYYKKADAKPLIFCHFARGLGEKVYNEVTEFRDLYKTLMEVSLYTFSGLVRCKFFKSVFKNPVTQPSPAVPCRL